MDRRGGCITRTAVADRNYPRVVQGRVGPRSVVHRSATCHVTGTAVMARTPAWHATGAVVIHRSLPRARCCGPLRSVIHFLGSVLACMLEPAERRASNNNLP